MESIINIGINTIAALTNIGDCRIMAGLKDGELQSVIDCGKMYETRWSLAEASAEIQEAVKAIVSKVGTCTIEVSWWTDWGYDGPCDISIKKTGTDILWVRFDPDGSVYDYLSKGVIIATTWPIGWDALRRLEELGYDPNYYQHVSEDGDGFNWTVQLIDPKDETLWEIDLVNNRTRHKGQELGCFWTKWEKY